MKLSSPIYILKQHAKALARREGIPLHQALDRIANREGFGAWSLLSAKATAGKPGAALLAQLRPGELVLVGSRPGQGKTLLGVELMIRNVESGNRAAFFTLDWTESDVADRFKVFGENLNTFPDEFLIDDSDDICADYVVAKLSTAVPSTLVVIDYLQLLDQKRGNSELMYQVQQLRNFARDRRLFIICLSQIDRNYDPAKEPCPGIGDVRLPNPLDLGLFDKMCFLNQGKMQIASST